MNMAPAAPSADPQNRAKTSAIIANSHAAAQCPHRIATHGDDFRFCLHQRRQSAFSSPPVNMSLPRQPAHRRKSAKIAPLSAENRAGTRRRYTIA